MSRLAKALRAEPVLLGGALTATLVWLVPDASEAAMAAWLAWVTLGQRLLSTPTAKVEAQVAQGVELGAAQAKADVTTYLAAEAVAQATTPPPAAPSRPGRPLVAGTTPLGSPG